MTSENVGYLPNSHPVLTARGITAALGGRPVLTNVDIDVHPGEFIGLIGSNGAGKTTLLRVLLGSLKPSSGTVTHHPGHGQEGDHCVGYLPQKVNLAPDIPLRVQDVVALGIDGGKLGLPLGRKGLKPRVDAALDAVGARDFADQRIGELSGGQQQRALLAHALVGQPSLLLLDEPLANLDPASAYDVVELLNDLRKRTGVAIVMTAHDMNVLLPVVDRLVYLAGGRAASGTPDEVVHGDVLSGLYGRPMRVIHAGGRALVIVDDVGLPEQHDHDDDTHQAGDFR